LRHVYQNLTMNSLHTVLLTTSIAFAINTYAQNATDNSNNSNSRQAPTIEDRLAQLEQDQQGLTGRVDALSKQLASLEQEIKTLEGQSSGSNGNSSRAPAGQVNETSGAANGSANETSGTAGASYDLFYDRLQSDGQWFNDPTYGSVWQPNIASSDQNWRPYTDGQWVYTDRGWTWVSNENFGWATYHYGRWARLSERGWVWVPGSTWAPAWVSWRESDDYVGWAPLPPEAESEHDVKIEGWVDNYYNIGPGSYIFVKTTDLANQSYRGFIVSSQDDLNIISRTKNVTNIYYGQAGVVDNGPDYDQLVQNSNVRIDRYKLNYVQQNNPETQFSETTRGDQLQVVAPAAHLQRAATIPPKIAGNLANAQVDRGWQNIDEARARQLKQSWEKQAPVPPSLPAKPTPPKPLFARAAGQSQAASQQPAAENREPSPPSATPQSNLRRNDETVAPTPSPNEKAVKPGRQPPANTNRNQRQELKQGERPETTPPAPNSAPSPNENAAQSGQQQPPTPNENRRQQLKQGERRETTPPAPNPAPSPNEKAHSGQQPPTPNENRRPEPNQGKRPETTPPAPSPSENERSIRQPERSETSPNKNRREEQGEGERAQPAANRAESPPSKNERPTQSEEKRGGGENLDQKAPGTVGGTEEKGGMPPKEEKTTRQLKEGDEMPAKGEEHQREGFQNPSKSNVEETERPTSEDKKEQGRDQSGEEKLGGKKRSDEPEKKKVGPSQQ
jgi:hypothetical protein